MCVYVCAHPCMCVPNPELEGCVGRSALCRYKLILGIQTLGALCRRERCASAHIYESCVCPCDADVGVGLKERKELKDRQEWYNDAGNLLWPFALTENFSKLARSDLFFDASSNLCATGEAL